MKCQFTQQDDKYVCQNCGHTTALAGLKMNCLKSPPNIVKRGANFVKAGARHIITGRKHCTPEQKQERYSKCSSNKCGLFLIYGEGGVCSHDDCGCFIRSQGQFLDKLSWAESSCPEGYWGPIIENDDKTPEKGV